MRHIYSPHPEIPDEERLSVCKSALEAAVWQLIDRAKEAGWSGTEATLATALLVKDRAEQEAHQHHASLMLDVG